MYRLVQLLAVLLLQLATADLPIHCLHKQVAGRWEFSLSDSSGDKTRSCGYEAPDRNAQHFTRAQYSFPVQRKVQFDLKEPHVAVDEQGTKGKWTMVYDEGFQVSVGGITYFSFFKYQPRTANVLTDDVEDYLSMCDRTMVGWYHDANNQHWGCYHGTKLQPDGKPTPGRGVVPRKTSLRGQPVLSPIGVDEAFLELDTQVQTNTHADGNTQLHVGPDALAASIAKQWADAHHTVVGKHPKVDPQLTFEPNYGFVELINADPTSTWKAAVHEPFKGKKMTEMLSMLGHSKFNKPRIRPQHAFASSDAVSLGEIDRTMSAHLHAHAHAHASTIKNTNKRDQNAGEDQTAAGLDTTLNTNLNLDTNTENFAGPGWGHDADETAGHVVPAWENEVHNGNGHGLEAELRMKALPTAWDWRDCDGVDYMTPIKNQGSCGSCYALAATAALESRYYIKTKKRVVLSPQQVLSCSMTNQGCEGGYPFLVGKFAHEYGLVSDDVVEYRARNDRCPDQQRYITPEFYADNYGYVGGYYGACNERRMMREILEHGPIVVAFQAPPTLFYYSGGVFTGEKPQWRELSGVQGVNDWEQTNHAVVCVGWGEDTSYTPAMKYWVIRNTWGESWGEGGYFRIRRGTDECAIESMAVFIEPKIVKKLPDPQADEQDDDNDNDDDDTDTDNDDKDD